MVSVFRFWLTSWGQGLSWIFTASAIVPIGIMWPRIWRSGELRHIRFLKNHSWSLSRAWCRSVGEIHFEGAESDRAVLSAARLLIRVLARGKTSQRIGHPVNKKNLAFNHGAGLGNLTRDSMLERLGDPFGDPPPLHNISNLITIPGPAFCRCVPFDFIRFILSKIVRLSEESLNETTRFVKPTGLSANALPNRDQVLDSRQNDPHCS